MVLIRWLFAITFSLLGVILFSLTIDSMGDMGRINMKIIGFGCFFLAGFIVRGKKKQQSS